MKPACPRKIWFGLYSKGQNPFLRLIVFWLFLCDTTLWQSDAVVWTTWNLHRMCARYSYLKLKKKFKIFFFKKSCLNFFSRKIKKKKFPKFGFPQLFSKKIIFFWNFFSPISIFGRLRNFFTFFAFSQKIFNQSGWNFLWALFMMMCCWTCKMVSLACKIKYNYG